MHRFVLLAMLVVLAAAGCGGSGDDSGSAPSAAEQASDSAASGDDASTSDEDAKTKPDADEKSSSGDKDEEGGEDDEIKTHEDSEQAQEEAIEKLPLERKVKLIETVARSALLRFGLRLVDVELTDGIRKVTVVVSRKGACKFVAKQEPNLALAIKEAVAGIRSLRFEVAGTGQQLGYYVLGCKKPEIPSGAGRVVLDHSGVGGPYKSKRFKITSKRWALEWVNEAASLAVIVKAVGGESKGDYFRPVASQKPDSDSYEYTGRGTFQITAYGAGGWRIRVRESG